MKCKKAAQRRQFVQIDCYSIVSWSIEISKLDSLLVCSSIDRKWIFNLSKTKLNTFVFYKRLSSLLLSVCSLSLIEASIKRIEIWSLNSNLISCYCYCSTYEVEDDDDTHSPSPNSITFRSWFLSLSFSPSIYKRVTMSLMKWFKKKQNKRMVDQSRFGLIKWGDD